MFTCSVRPISEIEPVQSRARALTVTQTSIITLHDVTVKLRCSILVTHHFMKVRYDGSLRKVRF